LYYNQHYLGFEVPNDAPLGTWSWTAVNLALAPTEIVASGTFVVTEDVSNSDILAMLEECCPIIMEIHETTVTINTTLGVIEADLSDIGASVTSIEGDVATISTDIGTLTGTVESIVDDVATIVTDLGTVKMDVTAIKDQMGDPVDLTPMWAAVVLSLIAALASIWAVLSISRRIA
jgi:flagellin-like hook-associated protein FlgL